MNFKDLFGRFGAGSQDEQKPAPDVTADPTPIPISRFTRALILLAVFSLLAYVIYRVPSVLTTAVGGFGLALVLSFPVRFLSRFVPRILAIVGSFLIVAGIFVLAALVFVPVVSEQVGALAGNLPRIAREAEGYLQGVLGLLRDRGLLPGDPAELTGRVREDLTDGVRTVAGGVLGGALSVVSGTVGFAFTLFGVVFVGVYLLLDVRRFKAVLLNATPHRYRRDARTLWDAFGYSLSRYLSGLAFVLFIQGALSAVALTLIGVPYALALGLWVSVTAVIPYVGAYIGAVPAVLVALTLPNPSTSVILVVILFVGIQQFEGNFLTPKIQGDALKVHPVLIFLGVLAGGGIAGIAGVLLATPVLAVLRVLFDFFRVRLQTNG